MMCECVCQEKYDEKRSKKKCDENPGHFETSRAMHRLVRHMKKLLLFAAAVFGTTVASQAGVNLHLGLPLPPLPPLPGIGVVIGRPAPRVIVQEPVECAPAPVVVAPPVYCPPPRVYYAPPPVVVYPRYEHYRHRGHYGRW